VLAVVRGALVVGYMGSGAAMNYAWYRKGVGMDDWTWVESAPIAIGHYPGEFAVLVQPLYMTHTYVTSPPIYVGTNYGDADDSYYLRDWGLKHPLEATAIGYGVDADGVKPTGRTDYAGTKPALSAGECRIAVADHEEDAPTNFMRWRAFLKPWAHTDNGITSYTSPGLVGVRLSYEPTLIYCGEPAVSEDVTSRVHSATLDYAEDLGATETTFRFHNKPEDSYWAKNIGLLRQFSITSHRWREYYPGDGTWQDANETSPLEYMWSLEPELEGYMAQVPMIDLFALLNLQRVCGQVPVGDGWEAWVYIRHILNLAQIGDTYLDLENIGVTLEEGTPEKPRWQPERGRRLGDYLQEVMRVGCHNGAIWAEGGQIRTGCRYCGAPRTPEDYKSHSDNGWNSSGCIAVDKLRNPSGIDLELFCNPEDATDPDALGQMTQVKAYYDVLDDERFANVIDVRGETDDGKAIGAQVRNMASLGEPTSPLYTGGWPIHHVETNPQLRTQSSVNERAYTLGVELSERPLWFRGTVVLDGSFLRGFVVAVKGGEALGLHNLKARIVSMSLPIVRDGVPLVELTCRTMGTVT